MINFPASPATGQPFTSPDGTVWIWDGVKWTGTGNPWTSVRYRNRIINGDMSVDQRNGGTVIAMPTTPAYIIDRWKLSLANLTASKGTVGQVGLAGPNLAATGFSYSFQWQTTTAYTPVAADAIRWAQFIEGCNFNDTNWGTANALPVTIEFIALSTLAGTFAGALTNASSTRSYVFTFTLVASTWTKVRITIPGDTTGTWAVAANASAAYLNFNIGTGANFQAATANVWSAGNFSTVAGAVNVVSTLNATLYVTGVALMVGAAAQNAEPEFRKYSDNLIDCQRYFWKPDNQVLSAGYHPTAASLTIFALRPFPVVMRANPAAPVPAYNNVNMGTITIVQTATMCRYQGANAAAGSCQLGIQSDTYDADF